MCNWQEDSWICRLLPTLALLAAHSAAFARGIDPADYPYPYPDPYLATSTVGILKGSDAQERKAKYRRIAILPNRDQIRFLEGKGTLRYRFQPQPHAAPLMVVVPGFGASAYSGSTRFLSGVLYEHGFHVLSLPSPFNWNFALAASSSGLPGLTERDSRELYWAIQAALRDIQSRDRPAIGNIGLIGFSHGALHAAYLSGLDAKQNRIGFDRILLINPPVDLMAAVRRIDRMAELGNRYSKTQRENIESYAFGVGLDALGRDIDGPGYFADWNRRLRLPRDALQYLIAKALRFPVGDTIYVIELLRHPGILKTPIRWGYRSARFEEADSYGLKNYLEVFLLPELKDQYGKRINLERFAEQVSVKGIESALRNNPRVHLMHNADDFLVSPSDLKYLEGLFGDRAIIYPHGGHLGNLWYPDNLRDLLHVFLPLLPNPAEAGK